VRPKYLADFDQLKAKVETPLVPATVTANTNPEA